jgi:PAS domain S-box-containing protein
VFYEELWNTIRCGRIWHGELINRRKDGTFYHEEMRITPVLGVNGEIVSYIAIKQDVTKRREAEEARRFLAAIVESSDDAIISKTLDGTISTWNEAAEALYGYRADEAIGEPISLLLPPDRQDEMSRILDCIRGGQRLSRFEKVKLTLHDWLAHANRYRSDHQRRPFSRRFARRFAHQRRCGNNRRSGYYRA